MNQPITENGQLFVFDLCSALRTKEAHTSALPVVRALATFRTAGDTLRVRQGVAEYQCDRHEHGQVHTGRNSLRDSFGA
ncbi:MAG: hypothetical protein KGJ51_13005, partial [Acidobacteriota bacterium]|nr:hypothetical protein [Acidobacteriota bacterium]